MHVIFVVINGLCHSVNSKCYMKDTTIRQMKELELRKGQRSRYVFLRKTIWSKTTPHRVEMSKSSKRPHCFSLESCQLHSWCAKIAQDFNTNLQFQATTLFPLQEAGKAYMVGLLKKQTCVQYMLNACQLCQKIYNYHIGSGRDAAHLEIIF